MDTKSTINTLFASKVFGDYVIRYNTNMEMYCITDLEKYFQFTSKKIYTWESKVSTNKLKEIMSEMYPHDKSMVVVKTGLRGLRETWVNWTLFVDYARFLSVEIFAIVIKQREEV